MSQGDINVKNQPGSVCYSYAPFPIDQYRLEGVPRDEFCVIRGCQRWLPIWNFFWLSEPRLDKLPGAGSRWHKVYVPSTGLLTQVIIDVNGSGVLQKALESHPVGFIDFWTSTTGREFRTYYNQGGESWYKTVLIRAREAEERLLKDSPPFSFKFLKDGR